MKIRIRPAELRDRDALVDMFTSLWPGPPGEHAFEIDEHFHNPAQYPFPTELLVAETDELAGFVQIDLRSHAEGCDPHRPVLYIEGWYVLPHHRGAGVGGALIRAAEDWGRAQGCLEMASDTWLDAEASQAAHQALGFEEVERSVHYRKKL